MRKFNVKLKHRNKHLLYENLTGAKALELMETLKKRKIESTAETSGFGITETLTLNEMRTFKGVFLTN